MPLKLGPKSVEAINKALIQLTQQLSEALGDEDPQEWKIRVKEDPAIKLAFDLLLCNGCAYEYENNIPFDLENISRHDGCIG